MQCKLAIEILEEYIEGELDESTKAMIEIHLADCESCRQELALSQSIPHLVNSLPTPSVPESIIPNTLMQLRKSTSIHWQWMRHLRWRFAVAVSLLIVAFLFGGISYQRLSNRQQHEPVSISSADNNLSVIKSKPPLNKPVKLLTKNQQKSDLRNQRKFVSHPKKKKQDMTEKEIASTVEGLKLAFGIVETATESIHFVILTEGTRVMNVTKSKYLDTMQAVSRYQSEFLVKLQRDLNIFGEVNEQ